MYLWPLFFFFKLDVRKCADLCLGLQFYSIDQFVCSYADTMLFHYCIFVAHLEIQNDDTSNSILLFRIILAMLFFSFVSLCVCVCISI